MNNSETYNVIQKNFFIQIISVWTFYFKDGDITMIKTFSELFSWDYFTEIYCQKLQVFQTYQNNGNGTLYHYINSEIYYLNHECKCI